jgi:hypothetical protein|tara:strand:+ start:2229 stop:3326 length:1098 start_codon:yes stop_codon:yes gene_type:complete
MIVKNNPIQFLNNSTIYIMAPAGVATGGPEALHQLGHILKKHLNLNVIMFYVPNDLSNPIHENYKKYLIKFTNSIEDEKDNILIIPEYFDYLNRSKQFKNIQKIIWWLSIDNYFEFRFRYKNKKLLRSIIKIPYNIISIFNKITFNIFGIYTGQDYLKFIYSFFNLNNHKEISQAKLHLVQSSYAYDFLENKILNIEHLYDYLKDDFFENINFDKKDKENSICYNPLKSNEFMKRIIAKNPNYKFISLINLSTSEIIKTLKKTKIYIDFGSHPGKDRIPREAILLGNCIITNKKGSAFNNNDIPISDEFKFNERYTNLGEISRKIISIFDNYDVEYEKFSFYLKKIYLEKELFIKQVKKIFNNTI